MLHLLVEFSRFKKRNPNAQKILDRVAGYKIEFKASKDFRRIVFHDIGYSLTLNQVQVMKILWEEYSSGIHEVHKDSLLENADIKSLRLKDIFKKTNAKLLGSLIVSGSAKGMYKLNLSPYFGTPKIIP